MTSSAFDILPSESEDLTDDATVDHVHDELIFAGDLCTAARERLVAALTTAGMIGTVVGADGEHDQSEGAWDDGWVFCGENQDGSPYRAVEGTGLAAVTLLEREEWGSNSHNSLRMPRLRVLIFADCDRDETGQPTLRAAGLARARAVMNVVVSCFHDAANATHVWGTGDAAVRIVSSVKNTEPNYTDVIDGDGAVRGDVAFEVVVPNDGWS